MSARGPRRRLLAPEVLQTSSMDCGPAALACLLEGFGVRASYGRLREACQTDVDGTSIDAVEEAAVALGLDAQQLLVPFEHLFLAEAETLPALVVVHHANGARHFVVAWRRAGALVQVMDPSVGRRWIGARRLLEQVYAHEMELSASAWLAWMAHPFHRVPLAARLERVGLARDEASARIESSLSSGGWKPAAALQAALAVCERLARAGAVRSGAESRGLLARLVEHALEDEPATSPHVPAAFWPARIARVAEGGEVVLRVSGAVAVRVRGRRAATSGSAAAGSDGSGAPAAAAPLSPELAAALDEPPQRPLRELARVLARDGALAPSVVAAALATASAAVFAQALLFRGLIELAGELASPLQRAGAAAVVLAFLAALLALELASTGALVRLGRHLEGRMRVAFQEKLPRLGDRYFRSRPAADMTERVHASTALRAAPTLAAQLLRTLLGLALTTAGLCWIAPGAALPACAAAALSIALPLATQRALGERELRARSQRASLGRFYLDAMLGLVAVRTHGAERAVRREHEALLAEWVRAARRFLRASVGVEALGALAGQALALWVVYAHAAPHLAAGGTPPGLLLVCFWALALPGLGASLAALGQQLPAQRNVAARVFEPLGAPEDSLAAPASPEAPPERASEPTLRHERRTDVQAEPRAALETRTHLRAAGGHGLATPVADAGADAGGTAASASAAALRAAAGISLSWRDVSVVAAGREILSGVTLDVRAGEHVAIVGRSGAGKSSLVGMLLGWHRAARGELLVGGARLDAVALAALRRATAWVDPSVQVWNRPLLSNLSYGSDADAQGVGEALAAARLEGVLATLPAGLATPLGQGGGLVSGGEGQRVRLARAFARSGVRLALLDEPFCGLDRDARRALLAEARGRWRDATLLCVTHDVGDTLGFERVLVVEAGRVVESGPPRELAAREGSAYRRLLDAEDLARQEIWDSPEWTRWRVERGAISAVGPEREDRPEQEDRPARGERPERAEDRA